MNLNTISLRALVVGKANKAGLITHIIWSVDSSRLVIPRRVCKGNFCVVNYIIVELAPTQHVHSQEHYGLVDLPSNVNLILIFEETFIEKLLKKPVFECKMCSSSKKKITTFVKSNIKKLKKKIPNSTTTPISFFLLYT